MSEPSREEVKELIARLRQRKVYSLSSDNDYPDYQCAVAADALTSLLALAYDKDTGEKHIERAAISEHLRKEALARLSEVEKALEPFAAQIAALEPDEDLPDDTLAWATLGDFRRARAALHPKGQ